MIALVIARNTFREATRDRVLLGLVVAGVAIMCSTLVLSPLALGEGHRLVVDLGLSSISLLGMFGIVLVGTNLVSKEIDRRTIYNLLSRPLPRPLYLLGKWGGLTAALWAVAAALGLALWGLAAARGLARFGPSLAEAVYLAGLELMVMTAIAVMFSALSTPVLSALYTIGLFCIGQWAYDLREFAAHLPPPVSQALAFFANVAPNLSLFNMRTLAAEGQLTTGLHLGLATGYAALYCGCVLALAAAAFESRDFK